MLPSAASYHELGGKQCYRGICRSLRLWVAPLCHVGLRAFLSTAGTSDTLSTKAGYGAARLANSSKQTWIPPLIFSRVLAWCRCSILVSYGVGIRDVRYWSIGQPMSGVYPTPCQSPNQKPAVDRYTADATGIRQNRSLTMFYE